MRTKNEQGSSNIMELFLAISLSAGVTAVVTPEVISILENVQTQVDSIQGEQLENLQAQADIQGEVTISAEDFAALRASVCSP